MIRQSFINFDSEDLLNLKQANKVRNTFLNFKLEGSCAGQVTFCYGHRIIQVLLLAVPIVSLNLL